MTWLQGFMDDRSDQLEKVAERGIFAGLIASAAMAVAPMVASVTYLGRGFFTPMYHAAFIIDPNTMPPPSPRPVKGSPSTSSRRRSSSA